MGREEERYKKTEGKDEDRQKGGIEKGKEKNERWTSPPPPPPQIILIIILMLIPIPILIKVKLSHYRPGRRIEAAEMKLLRPLAGYTLYDHKTNDYIRRELRITSLLDKLD